MNIFKKEILPSSLDTLSDKVEARIVNLLQEELFLLSTKKKRMFKWMKGICLGTISAVVILLLMIIKDWNHEQVAGLGISAVFLMNPIFWSWTEWFATKLWLEKYNQMKNNLTYIDIITQYKKIFKDRNDILNKAEIEELMTLSLNIEQKDYIKTCLAENKQITIKNLLVIKELTKENIQLKKIEIEKEYQKVIKDNGLVLLSTEKELRTYL